MLSLSDALQALVKSVLPPCNLLPGYGGPEWNIFMHVEISEGGEVWLKSGERRLVGEIKIVRFLPEWVAKFVTDPSFNEYDRPEFLWGTVEEVVEFRRRLVTELVLDGFPIKK
jgi:hypothetical protein